MEHNDYKTYTYLTLKLKIIYHDEIKENGTIK